MQVNPVHACSTTIWSALAMVLSLCATMMAVRPSRAASSALMMRRSVTVSSELVASSRISIRGSLRMARAMATRCFSPPLSRRPRSPTTVS